MRAWIVMLVVVLLAELAVAPAATKTRVRPRHRKPGAAAPTKAPAKPASPAPAPAAETASTAPASPPAEIVAGGIVILRLRTTVAGMTPADREAALYERINTIISDRNVQPANVKAIKQGYDWLVMAGPHLFVTVTAGEAMANKATPMELAQIWASNLRIAIPLARPEPVVLPPK